MKIAISGASGLVGSAISRRRGELGDEIVPMKRDPEQASGGRGIFWSAELGLIDEAALEGFDAVIHLAGENIAGGPWTETRRAEIRDSRVRGTWLLAGALSHVARPPKVLLVASAVGYYGDRGDEELTEESSAGMGYLAEVCAEWECAAKLAREAGIRVVHLRLGAVLAKSGGMLPRLLPVFRAGLGGKAGSGRQFISWIALPDLVRAVDFLLANDDVAGPVNVTSPEPVRNAEFASVLGRVLHRPSVVTVPAGVLKLTTGQLAQEVILASARALPERLLSHGFTFEYPGLEAALRHVLGAKE
jgi:uncharacterized protein